MNAYIFPGQGSQFTGMGLDLYEQSIEAQHLFEDANDILGFNITDLMFEGDPKSLKETKVTQPAIFLHSVVLSKMLGNNLKPHMVAGHSLGEFSALVANQTLTFEDGLKLVAQRAMAMQKACELQPSSMAAILGLKDHIVEKTCESTPGIVVTANYNCPGQLVISGELNAINKAIESLKEAGARVVILPINGAFHSPLMASAKEELASAIEQTTFHKPNCPIYQNVTASAVMKASEIKSNLISQLTAPVKWKQSVEKMIADGATLFTEVGPGKVLQGLVKKINKEAQTASATIQQEV